MVDERVIRRIDLFLVLFAGWCVLSLVVASVALMMFRVALGSLALATVVLTVVVGVMSYQHSTGPDPELRLEIR